MALMTNRLLAYSNNPERKCRLCLADVRGEKWMRDKRTPKDVCGEAKLGFDSAASEKFCFSPNSRVNENLNTELLRNFLVVLWNKNNFLSKVSQQLCDKLC